MYFYPWSCLKFDVRTVSSQTILNHFMCLKCCFFCFLFTRYFLGLILFPVHILPSMWPQKMISRHNSILCSFSSHYVTKSNNFRHNSFLLCILLFIFCCLRRCYLVFAVVIIIFILFITILFSLFKNSLPYLITYFQFLSFSFPSLLFC